MHVERSMNLFMQSYGNIFLFSLLAIKIDLRWMLKDNIQHVTQTPSLPIKFKQYKLRQCLWRPIHSLRTAYTENESRGVRAGTGQEVDVCVSLTVCFVSECQDGMRIGNHAGSASDFGYHGLQNRREIYKKKFFSFKSA